MKMKFRKDYAQARREEYPPVAEFMDAYYWSRRGKPEAMKAWLKKIDAIKQKFPKDKG